MLQRYRRHWVFLAAGLLALPLVGMLLGPAGANVSVREARSLAPAPRLPDSAAGWVALPRQVDAYLEDHFGLRPLLLRAYAVIMNRMLEKAGNPRVLVASDGWMFFRGDAMLQQSAGMLRRDREVAETADLLASMHRALAAKGIPMLVASPPNSATIIDEKLPLWARSRGRSTEYDALLDDLAAAGVPAVDLRPALRAAKAAGKVYLEHDTHWTTLGELAGFNAVVRADGHADWALDPAAVLGPVISVAGGDLARILGVDADVTERERQLVLPMGRRDTLDPRDPFSTFVETGGGAGPTIMIIGDSFTQNDFASMLLRHVGRVVWEHHRRCGFDWTSIDRFHPDEVWWMPTERYLVCGPGAWPAGFPSAVAAAR